MIQTQDKSPLFPRWVMGISALVMVLGLGVGAVADVAMAQTQSKAQSGTSASASTGTESDGALTPNEILALFEREARAAYAMNKQACDELAGDDQQRCLAAARLQFDADMRYAQRRAAQGY